jgi:hypothetical protein
MTSNQSARVYSLLIPDAEKCEQRNRINAHKYAMNSMAIQIRSFWGELDGDYISNSAGEIPKGETAIMNRINALRPAGSDPLTLADVYVVYAEAANNNFISDRYMFMGTSTLKNVAAQANMGTAFMNSHRFGYEMSSEAQLPFGKTFAGRYEQGADGLERVLLGVYMMRGVAPNGADGPTTDDMYQMIQGGTINDVSVTLIGGDTICDVCSLPLARDYEDFGVDGFCAHAIGTTSGMDKSEIKAQKARGVTDGAASFTINNAAFLEVSAVYAGAVPGAGFTETLYAAPLNAGVISGPVCNKLCWRQGRIDLMGPLQGRPVTLISHYSLQETSICYSNRN